MLASVEQVFKTEKDIISLILYDKQVVYDPAPRFLNSVRINMLCNWDKEYETKVIDFFYQKVENREELKAIKEKLALLTRTGNLEGKIYSTDTQDANANVFKCLMVLMLMKVLNMPIVQ